MAFLGHKNIYDRLTLHKFLITFWIKIFFELYIIVKILYKLMNTIYIWLKHIFWGIIIYFFFILWWSFWITFNRLTFQLFRFRSIYINCLYRLYIYFFWIEFVLILNLYIFSVACLFWCHDAFCIKWTFRIFLI